MSLPLAGVRVIDLSTEIAGPYCTKLLADAGADVLKVELPGGDPLRRWTASGTPLAPGEDGALFRFLNTSKRSAVVDYTSASGCEQLLALAAHAGLVIESTTPGTIESLGLEPNAIWQRNRAASLVSISPFGGAGPWSNRPATEFTLQALCGSTAARGTMDRPPIAAGGRLGEWMGGAYAAVAALTAYYGTRRSGRGEHVDLSLFEVMALTMAPNLTVWESLAGQASQFSRTLEIPSIESAKDGYIGFCTITGQQWRDFLVLVERPDLLDDEDLARWDGRLRRADEVHAFVQAWTKQHTVDEIIERAAALRVPVGALGTGETVPRFDHFVARGAFVQHPGTNFVQPRPPYRMSDASLRPFSPAPKLGEHAAAWQDTSPHHIPLTQALSRGERGRSGALAGLRVIDFTAFWAGPFATHYLAAMGADVIKIESIQRPDGMRLQSVKPPTTDQWWEWGALFQGVNLGKRSVTLDLTRPAGVTLVKRLLAQSDVAIENFSPRVMDNLGIVYDELAVANPRLIMVRMPAFGLDGPWRERVGFAQTMEQISGMAWLTGFADGAPVIPRGPCDPLAGLHAVAALLVALEHRERSGRGQLIEATMVEAALNAAAEVVLEHGAYGVQLTRDGNRGPVGAPQNLYPCRGGDRWLALAVTTDAQWQALVEVMDAPRWGGAADLASAEGRRAQHDQIDRNIAAWCIDCDAETLAEALLARGVPAAPVMSAAALGRNPQLRARGFFEAVTHSVVGKHEFPTLPVRLPSDRAAWYHRPSPTLGEHSEEILRELLGLSDAELAALRADGIIGNRPTGL
ncbi:MAG: CoA transferase [Deltaproteobacteria bacterium]|nr:CoA transferase [Deltaproteobacteria bacterium]MBI3389773.1 CoA transferase [Deltaproteobacteria bacterium]